MNGQRKGVNNMGKDWRNPREDGLQLSTPECRVKHSWHKLSGFDQRRFADALASGLTRSPGR